MSVASVRASSPDRDGRYLVLGVAVGVLVLKLIVAATTYGTNDVTHWQDFVSGVRHAGPIRVYGVVFPHSYYNHPPLMGYVLQVISWLHQAGVSVGLAIRALASAADVVSAMVVFALVLPRRGRREAVAAGIVVGCSPVLFLISGFHGNTDPIFSMLALLSAYLLVDRHRPGWSGAALALAFGVKIVAVLALPALLVYAARRGRRELLRFATAALGVFALTWGPALVLEGTHVHQQVIDYAGLGRAQWGFMQLGHLAHNPWWVHAAQHSGRTLIVLLCAVVPAIAVWRSPRSTPVAVAVALTAFLALSPQFAEQYMAWAAAATVVVNLWLGLAYNVLAGALLLVVYDHWSHGFFATATHVASYQPLTHGQVGLAVAPWVAALLTTVYGVSTIARNRRGAVRSRIAREAQSCP